MGKDQSFLTFTWKCISFFSFFGFFLCIYSADAKKKYTSFQEIEKECLKKEIDCRSDQDHDSIPDSLDHCVYTAEDLDRYEDFDGCPELDNDLDGIEDLKDHCPNQPETYNGSKDDDGCPDSNWNILKTDYYQSVGFNLSASLGSVKSVRNLSQPTEFKQFNFAFLAGPFHFLVGGHNIRTANDEYITDEEGDIMFGVRIFSPVGLSLNPNQRPSWLNLNVGYELSLYGFTDVSLLHSNSLRGFVFTNRSYFTCNSKDGGWYLDVTFNQLAFDDVPTFDTFSVNTVSIALGYLFVGGEKCSG